MNREYENKKAKNTSLTACCKAGALRLIRRRQSLRRTGVYRGRGKLAEYVQLERLPALTLHLLYKRGKKDKQNYLKEYLNIDVVEVVINKSVIYSASNTPTKMYFIKGDVVTVIEEQDDWLKVEYEGKKLVTGWIKRGDVRD
ncbi:hypothetical protein AGMMS49982_08830 [Bacteroidia bacterium]|nr:hypothetical protein AGMMS49982_08830 [Bacteroidia bacterium]